MIIVKSIEEKPKECRDCRLFDEVTYDCLINSESPAYTTCEEQYEHCPIEEAPDINVGNIDTTTHDSIPAETGKNDGDRTSGDCISRTQAIDALCKSECGCSNAECRYNGGTDFCVTCDNVKELKSLPSAQPDIIRCKDCKYYKFGICMKIGANKSFYGFCDWAERGEQNE